MSGRSARRLKRRRASGGGFNARIRYFGNILNFHRRSRVKFHNIYYANGGPGLNFRCAGALVASAIDPWSTRVVIIDTRIPDSHSGHGRFRQGYRRPVARVPVSRVYRFRHLLPVASTVHPRPMPPCKHGHRPSLFAAGAGGNRDCKSRDGSGESFNLWQKGWTAPSTPRLSGSVANGRGFSDDFAVNSHSVARGRHGSLSPWGEHAEGALSARREGVFSFPEGPPSPPSPGAELDFVLCFDWFGRADLSRRVGDALTARWGEASSRFFAHYSVPSA